jgi:hypothetical protein
MTFVELAHVNDIGTTFVVTINDLTSSGGSAVADISDATSMVLYFKRSCGSTFSRTAGFTTDGTDGKIEYTTVDGDLNGAGNWEIQAKVVTPSGTWSTGVGYFKVYENIY